MKFLVIDTATSTTVVHLIRGSQHWSVESKAHRRADDLLCLIDSILQERNYRLGELDGIVVRRGIGSYTGLRVGVTVANTLAWSTNLPICDVLSRRLTPLPAHYFLARRNHVRTAFKQGRGGRRPVVPIYGRWQVRRSSATL